VEGGVVIGVNRMRRVLEVDYASQRAVIEPGLINTWLSQHVNPEAITTHPILPVRARAVWAGTWPRIPAARTA